MGFLKFSDQFRVGHFLLDQQHEELFALLSRLHEVVTQKPSPAELQCAMAPLHFAILNHFQTEETLMRNNLYPGYLDHKRVHEGVITRLNDAESQLKRSDPALPLSVANFLKDWLQHHISQEDRLIVAHLESRKGNPAPGR
jgi:hemerythrin